MLVLATILLACLASQASSVLSPQLNWGYRYSASTLDPERWYQNYSSCGGSSQSPINIEEESTVFKDFGPLRIGRTGLGDEVSELFNRNYKLFLFNNNYNYYVYWEGKSYNITSTAFHWAKSEHAINGKHGIAEYRLKFKGLDNQKDSIYVSFLISNAEEHHRGDGEHRRLRVRRGNRGHGEHQEHRGHKEHRVSPGLKKVVDNVDKVQTWYTGYKLGLSYKDIIPMKIDRYFVYDGSESSPTCDSAIRITVESPILYLRKCDIEKFQQLTDFNSQSIPSNVRPLQNLNGRTVYRSFQYTEDVDLRQ